MLNNTLVKKLTSLGADVIIKKLMLENQLVVK